MSTGYQPDATGFIQGSVKSRFAKSHSDRSSWFASGMKNQSECGFEKQLNPVFSYSHRLE